MKFINLYNKLQKLKSQKLFKKVFKVKFIDIITVNKKVLSWKYKKLKN